MPPPPFNPGGGSKPKPKPKAKPKARSGGGGGSSRAATGGGDAFVPGLTAFGQPVRRSQFLQAKQHYDDIFLAWMGRRARDTEVRRLIQRGTSDYQLRLALVKRPRFSKSPMYKHYQAAANSIMGIEYKPSRNEILRAVRVGGSSGDLQAVLSQSKKAAKALTTSFRQTSGADVQYLSGAFGEGQLDNNQMQALALSKSGLRPNTLGASLTGSLETALARMRRIFEGTLAQPSLSLQGGRLAAPSLNPEQEPDLPA